MIQGEKQFSEFPDSHNSEEKIKRNAFSIKSFSSIVKHSIEILMEQYKPVVTVNWEYA